MNRHEFEAAVENARPGAKIVYYTGHLFGGDRKIGLHFMAVDNVSRAAWAAMEEGKVHLVQKRVKDGVFDYTAIKRPVPFKKVRWSGCYHVAHKPPADAVKAAA